MCPGWNRTPDLWIWSPTSYHCTTMSPYLCLESILFIYKQLLKDFREMLAKKDKEFIRGSIKFKDDESFADYRQRIANFVANYDFWPHLGVGYELMPEAQFQGY